MITVFKYEVSPVGMGIELPIGAEVLSVAFQRDKLCLWAKVDTEAKTETRSFGAFGTGHEIFDEKVINHKFIGTAHMDNGLVFHVFEKIGL